jgi:hypothetical protein
MISLYSCLPLAGAVMGASPQVWDLKDLFQQAHIVVEASPIPRSARQEPIAFLDTAPPLPTLPREAWSFIRGTVHKNILGQDLPDTLVVFAAGTGAAVFAHRANAAGDDPEPRPIPWYRGPLSPSAMARERSVVLFLHQVIDDSLVVPATRFELAAEQGCEKAANKGAVRKLAARMDASNSPF